MEPKQSCGTCSRVLGEPREEKSTVSCNGPCRKAFHALCVDLDLTIFNACTGLLWFCQNCRLDFNEEARHRRSVLQGSVQRMLGEFQKLAEKVDSLEEDVKRVNQQAAIPTVKRRINADSNDSKRKCNKIVGESMESIIEETTNRDQIRTEVIVSVPRKTNPQFPEKIWAKVFDHLNFEDLCHARLISGQWKKIVDGCLMSNFVLKISNCGELKIDPIPSIPSLPASTIVVESSKISAVGPWWCPSITEKLVNLELYNCNISLTNLLTMLRHAPNLVSLRLLSLESDITYDETVSEFSGLRLEKMMNLTLNRVQQDEILATFSRICPQLKYFALLSDYHECYQGVLKIIKEEPGLAEISLVSSSNDLSHLAEVNHQFKRISIAITTLEGEELKENLIRFTKNQPFLECLKLEIRGDRHIDTVELKSEDLCPIFQNLLKLTRLSINIAYFRNLENNIIDLSSIGCLTELEHFEINGGSGRRTFSIAGAKNPKLRELSLASIKFTPQLRDYIANAPNLRIITMSFCATYRSGLFTAIRWEDLRCLKLDTVLVPSHDEFRLCEYIDGLRCLEIRRCNMEKRFLSTLFGMCPGLEELCLKEMENVRDSVVLESFQKMKQLRKLTFTKCSITDHSASHIAEHALNLEQITIEFCEKLTNEGITQLKEAKITVLYKK